MKNKKNKEILLASKKSCALSPTILSLETNKIKKSNCIFNNAINNFNNENNIANYNILNDLNNYEKFGNFENTNLPGKLIFKIF